MSYEYFVETAPSHREAEELVFQKYGTKARITKKRRIQKGGFLGFGRKQFVEVSGFISLEPIKKRAQLPVASKRAYIHDSQSGESPELDMAKQEVLRAAGIGDSAIINKIFSEVKGLRDDVHKAQNNRDDGNEPASLRILREILEENEFTPKYIQHIQSKFYGLSMKQVEDEILVQQKVLEWISESISIQKAVPGLRPRVMVLIGPTGVGKTTTIAKLAGLECTGKLDGKNHSVRIITTDHYRIAAYQQMEKYAHIMQAPLEKASTPEELKKWLTMYHDTDNIFIDTPGHSPNDFERLGHLNTLLQACGTRVEFYLTLSACTRRSDIKRIMQQFEPFNYSSTIITKIDEAASLGTVISILWEQGKTVSFITYGQGVPNDLQEASVEGLIKHLTGFTVNNL